MEEESEVAVARTERQRFWLAHLKACEEQQVSLKAYACEHELSVSALYAARSAMKQRASTSKPQPRSVKSTLVPVRVASPPSIVRVLLPNGIVVDVSESIEPARLSPLLASVSTLP